MHVSIDIFFRNLLWPRLQTKSVQEGEKSFRNFKWGNNERCTLFITSTCVAACMGVVRYEETLLTKILIMYIVFVKQYLSLTNTSKDGCPNMKCKNTKNFRVIQKMQMYFFILLSRLINWHTSLPCLSRECSGKESYEAISDKWSLLHSHLTARVPPTALVSAVN